MYLSSFPDAVENTSDVCLSVCLSVYLLKERVKDDALNCQIIIGKSTEFFSTFFTSIFFES